MIEEEEVLIIIISEDQEDKRGRSNKIVPHIERRNARNIHMEKNGTKFIYNIILVPG